VRQLKKLTAAVAARAARRYVGGADLAGALATCKRLGPRTRAFTFGFWNATGADPEEVVARYAETADALRGAPFAGRIALKVPALGFRPDVIESLLRRVPAGVGLHLDSHGTEAQDATLTLAAPGMGVTLPSRWRRSVHDVERIADRGLEVRIVKGQFPAAPADEVDPSAGFLALARALAGRVPRVFVASHDVPLARGAVELLRARGTPCEIELLYGLPSRRAFAAAAQLGVPARVYVPWGTAYLPYALGKVRQDPLILARLARDLFLGER
jgi:proline dehydrogenase